MRPVRAVVYGVGKVGLVATSQMVEKGIQIVAAFNRPGNKIGKDIGEIAGLGRKLGVLVEVVDPERMRHISADVAMVSVYDDVDRMMPILKSCVEAGWNVITPASEMSFPWRIRPAASNELDALARRHEVSVVATGNQDIFMINAPILLSGACQSITSMTHLSLTNVDIYGAEVARLVRVGERADSFRKRQSRDDVSNVYVHFLENVAAGLNLTVASIRQAVLPVTLKQRVRCVALGANVKAGDVVGMSYQNEILTKEGIKLVGRSVMRVLGAHETERKSWRIQGEPNLRMTFGSLNGAISTTAQMVNRIPDVLNAPPGLINVERLASLSYRGRAMHDYVLSLR